MIGETTLAMLYVPLFFYLFDRLKERGETVGYDASAARSRTPQPSLPPEIARPIPNREDDYRAGLGALLPGDLADRRDQVTESGDRLASIDRARCDYFAGAMASDWCGVFAGGGKRSGRRSGTNPLRFGICTFGSVCAFISASSATIFACARMYAVSA